MDTKTLPKQERQKNHSIFPKIFEIEPKKLTSSVEHTLQMRISDGQETEKENRSVDEEADDVIIDEAQLDPLCDFQTEEYLCESQKQDAEKQPRAMKRSKYNGSQKVLKSSRAFELYQKKYGSDHEQSRKDDAQEECGEISPGGGLVFKTNSSQP